APQLRPANGGHRAGRSVKSWGSWSDGPISPKPTPHAVSGSAAHPKVQTHHGLTPALVWQTNTENAGHIPGRFADPAHLHTRMGGPDTQGRADAGSRVAGGVVYACPLGSLLS